VLLSGRPGPTFASNVNARACPQLYRSTARRLSRRMWLGLINYATYKSIVPPSGEHSHLRRVLLGACRAQHDATSAAQLARGAAAVSGVELALWDVCVLSSGWLMLLGLAVVDGWLMLLGLAHRPAGTYRDVGQGPCCAGNSRWARARLAPGAVRKGPAAPLARSGCCLPGGAAFARVAGRGVRVAERWVRCGHGPASPRYCPARSGPAWPPNTTYAIQTPNATDWNT
jgi:hypothetical protein